jgi:hypothetical protein
MADADSSKRRLLIAKILVNVVAVALIASAVTKIAGVQQVIDNFVKFHLSEWVRPIGGLECAIAAMLSVARTRSLGILLVTGYFGGAIVAHLTTDAPAELVLPLLLGAIAWVGYYLEYPEMFASFRRR